MNIDYSKIIEAANKRKDALQAFEDAVRELLGEINDSGSPDLIEAAHTFQRCARALDYEALKLLPVNPAPVMQFVDNLLSQWAYVDKVSGSMASPRATLYQLDAP